MIEFTHSVEARMPNGLTGHGATEEEALDNLEAAICQQMQEVRNARIAIHIPFRLDARPIPIEAIDGIKAQAETEEEVETADTCSTFAGLENGIPGCPNCGQPKSAVTTRGGGTMFVCKPCRNKAASDAKAVNRAARIASREAFQARIPQPEPAMSATAAVPKPSDTKPSNFVLLPNLEDSDLRREIEGGIAHFKQGGKERFLIERGIDPENGTSWYQYRGTPKLGQTWKDAFCTVQEREKEDAWAVLTPDGTVIGKAVYDGKAYRLAEYPAK